MGGLPNCITRALQTVTANDRYCPRTPLATAFVAAGEEMGYQNRDGNGEFQTGFMIPQVGLLFNSAPNDVLTSVSEQDLTKQIIDHSVQYTATVCDFCLCCLYSNRLTTVLFAILVSDSIDYHSENPKILRHENLRGFLLFLTVPCVAGCHIINRPVSIKSN